MSFIDRWLGRGEQRSIENPSIPVSASFEELMGFFGILERNNALPIISTEAALQVPVVWSIVNFLPRTLASLPLHTFKAGENGDRVNDPRAQLLSFAPNPEETSYAWRVYHWHQVFTGGRGLSWIERFNGRAVGIWPMNPSLTEISRRNGRKSYHFEGRTYDATDVIDTPFMMKRDRLGSYSPIAKCNKAISLAIAMGDFAGGFFAGGGVPPYALEGPLPSGADAMKRAQEQIQRAIELARQSGRSFFGMPPGHSLKPIGIDPAKGQMTEARLFQVQECARIWQMPPTFVGDLSKGSFSNTEQEDLRLAKHLVMQWAKALEDELTLKLYGMRPSRRVKHGLDGLQRGAFKDRSEALARAIMTGQLTPNESRALENRPPKEHGDQLYIQQATVPLGTKPGIGHNGGPALDDDTDEEDGADAGTQE
ncbi:phage portal protein [Qipengyuania sp.]|uniref:phage portal protein n=1 Tax=Qipengyuania sp. TaxID=2004515 RepID=UPI0035C7D39B